ncbi:hypothetical protein [Paenibacillus sp. 453mf]|uniref:hypothetical protein n=1 Tax=Paenibacillus sp. 453mf TaxID=1761874 RepID=UPI0008E6F912|nr:hypothetical protein [Paenibacillus sp. 453mf]SFS96494.1 hypothetical protein SAMN04488601_1111 [Paenibacillus sp. 453mf]
MFNCVVIVLMVMINALGHNEWVNFDQTQEKVIKSYENRTGLKITLPTFIPYSIKKTETNDISKEQIEIRYYGVETGDQILLSISKENKKFDRINHYDGAPYAKKIFLKGNVPAVMLTRDYKSLTFVDSGIQYIITDFTGRPLNDQEIERVANSML